MTTFMFKHKDLDYTPVSNIFIDKYMPTAKGIYIKVYLLGLRYCIAGELGINSSSISSMLSLSDEEIMEAWNYWNEEGIVEVNQIDTMGNYSIEFLNLIKINNSSTNNTAEKQTSITTQLEDSSIKDMMQDIQKLLGRTLSSKEMSMYLSWKNDFNYTPEIILLLIQYSLSKGKTDHRYIEQIAISWHDAKVRTVDDAQNFIKRHEDKWLNMRKILKYLGIQSSDIMKPQEQLLEKWIDVYQFPLDIIYKACDVCFERINKADFKYIDAILNNWFKSEIKTLEDIEKKDTLRSTNRKKNSYYENNRNSASSKDTFSNRKQRFYDLDEIEKKLLGWDNND